MGGVLKYGRLGKRMTMKSVVGLVVSVAVGVFLSPVVQAQVLDQRVNDLLANNCFGLLQGAGSGVLGPNLAAACTGGPGATGTGTSAGGGAASVQASAASILNRTILSRLDEIRNDSGQKMAAGSSSLRINPLGIMASGMIRGFGAMSPMNPTGDSSSASFNTGNQSRMKGFGFFASGLVESLNRDITTFQDGYKSTILGITAGVDYRFNQQTVAGLAVNYANTQGDFRGGGDFYTNRLGFTLFGSYLPTDRTFIQLTGGYSHSNYLVSRVTQGFIPGIAGGPDRTLGGLAGSTSNGDIIQMSALVGYDQPVGMFTVGPRIGFNYTNTHIHNFAETSGGGLGLRYDDQWINSVQSLLGVQAQAAVSTGIGVLVPQVNADYIYEFANSQRFIAASFVEDNRANPLRFTFQNDVPVRNYFNLGTGLLMVLQNGWQPFVNFRAMVGNEQFQNYAGMFGLRVEL